MVKVLFIPGKNSRTDDFLAMLRPNRRVFYLSAKSGNMVLTEDPELFVLELPADRTPCDFGAQAVVIGAGGVEKVVEVKLSDEAKANLQVSVDAVKELLVACKGIDNSLG